MTTKIIWQVMDMGTAMVTVMDMVMDMVVVMDIMKKIKNHNKISYQVI